MSITCAARCSGSARQTRTWRREICVAKPIEFEVERHIKTLEEGGRLVQETRLWDERLNETRAMRSKEEAHDYRYFPEPDLPPLTVDKTFIQKVRAGLPELPGPRAKRFS